MRLSLDTEACVGHGRCYALAPEIFDCDDQGHAVLKLQDVPREHEGDARAAVSNCPEAALSLDEP